MEAAKQREKDSSKQHNIVHQRIRGQSWKNLRNIGERKTENKGKKKP